MNDSRMMQNKDDELLMEMIRKHTQKINMLAMAIYDGAIQKRKDAIQELLNLQIDALNIQREYIKIHGSGLLNREFISDIDKKTTDLQEIGDLFQISDIDKPKHLR